MTAAAFFDLDRTLLLHASGTTFAKHLEAQGITSSANVPGAELLVSIYDIFGETRLNMELAQRLVKTAKGWPVDAVKTAAKHAAEELYDEVPGFAKLLIEEHRENGVKLVIATTSPTVLVQPLADRLGFDHLIATEWSHDGTEFDGTTTGPFVWGTRKRDAIVEWSSENDIQLSKSFAYSDSYYDASMLDVVGHPVAVNPDPRLTALAVLQGWPIQNFDAPPGVVKMAGLELQDWLRPFTRPEFVPLANWRFEGVENIPSDGPTILAFNHRSYFDTMTMQLLIAKTGRPCRFLAKKEVFQMPIIGQIAQIIGGIKVDRGTGSDAPLRAAVKALDAGEMVAIAPQGTIPRGPAFFDPVLKGRHGVAQLAGDTGAPVIPIGLWGTEKVWPRNQRLPVLEPLSRPDVSVNVGTAVELKGKSLDADTKRIMSAISALLPDEANLPHDPTEEELARTYPPGHEVDS